MTDQKTSTSLGPYEVRLQGYIAGLEYTRRRIFINIRHSNFEHLTAVYPALRKVILFAW